MSVKLLVTAIAAVLLSFGISASDEIPFPGAQSHIPAVTINYDFSKKPAPAGSIITGSFFLNIPKRWHLYAPGVKKYHRLTFENGTGPIKQAHFVYPPSSRMTISGVKTPVYEGTVEVIVEGVISEDAEEGAHLWRPVITWQSCSETICLPPESRTVETLIVVGSKK